MALVIEKYSHLKIIQASAGPASPTRRHSGVENID